MKFNFRYLSPFVLGASVVAASGCAMLPGGSFSAGDERLTGLLHHQDGQWQVTPCGSEAPVALAETERVQRLFERVAQPGQTAIFVDLQGTMRGSQMRAVEVLRMESTGRGCEHQRPAADQWAANGLHHSWGVAVDEQGIQFTGNENERVGPVSVIAEELPDGSMNFRAEQGNPLELWLYPQDCFDYSGDFKHFTATLVVNGKRLNGCAYKGEMTL